MSCLNLLYRHARLVNNIYPGGPGEEGPRSSALSLLVFYATSKPLKLQKIGIHLQKRITADLRKLKYQHVKVSLQIITTLIIECQQHIALISKYLMRIVLMLQACNDTDIVIAATNVFVLFNVSYKHENIDKEFTQLYLNLVKSFHLEASKAVEADLNVQHKLRLSGLKALESLCMSESFMGRSDLTGYLQMIIPAIMANIPHFRETISEDKVTTKHYDAEKEVDIQTGYTPPATMSIQDSMITQIELRSIAINCYVSLLAKSSSNSLKSILVHIYEYLDSFNLWDLHEYILKLFKIGIEAIKSEYRYIVTMSLFQKIQGSNDTIYETKVIDLVTDLVGEEAGAVGLTVPELLEFFCMNINRVCAAQITPETQNLHHSLVGAIGCISRNAYYAGQINDVVHFLICKLQESKATSGVQVLLLKSLAMSVKAHGEGPKPYIGANTNSYIPTRITVDTCHHSVIYLTDSDPDMRNAAGMFIHELLIQWRANDLQMAQPESCDFESFVMGLRHAIYTLGVSLHCSISDLALIKQLLIDLLRIRAPQDMKSSIPLLFHIQDILNDRVDIVINNVVSCVLISYLEAAGICMNWVELIDICKRETENRKLYKIWYPLDFSEEKAVELIGDQCDTMSFTSLLGRVELLTLIEKCMKSNYVAEWDELARDLETPFTSSITCIQPLKERLMSVDRKRGHSLLNSVVTPTTVPLAEEYDDFSVDNLKLAISTTCTTDLASNVDKYPQVNPTACEADVLELLESITTSYGTKIGAEKIDEPVESVESEWLNKRTQSPPANSEEFVEHMRTNSITRGRNRKVLPFRVKEPLIFDADEE